MDFAKTGGRRYYAACVGSDPIVFDSYWKVDTYGVKCDALAAARKKGLDVDLTSWDDLLVIGPYLFQWQARKASKQLLELTSATAVQVAEGESTIAELPGEQPWESETGYQDGETMFSDITWGEVDETADDEKETGDDEVTVDDDATVEEEPAPDEPEDDTSIAGAGSETEEEPAGDDGSSVDEQQDGEAPLETGAAEAETDIRGDAEGADNAEREQSADPEDDVDDGSEAGEAEEDETEDDIDDDDDDDDLAVIGRHGVIRK